jgi:4-amino-4-deoxy-L-arabinose transferase-like glycosyltransferase
MMLMRDPQIPSHKQPRYRIGAFFIALAFFLAVAPTLPWQEFSSGPENLVLATSMEMRRGGPVLVPTLQGEARIAKPPLAAWITAAAISPQTMRDIDTLDYAARKRGFFFLAIQSRWPALLSACLLLLGVFELGNVIRDGSFGLVAMSICATTYFLLRFARYSTTDIQLALWVTWGNVFLAQALLKGRWWSGCAGAGVALGFAMLSKGPVCLVQSVVPVVVFALVARRSSTNVAHPLGRAIVVGTVLFLIVGLWWYVVVLARSSGVIHRWFSEVTRIGATDTPASSVFTYFAIVGFVVPWTVFFVLGFVVVVQHLRARTISPDLLAFLFLVVPIAVMTFAKDRQDRYLLPMVPAAALVAAIGVKQYLSSWDAPKRADRLVAALHWITLGAIAIVLPILGGTTLLKQRDRTPWFPMHFAFLEAALGAVLVLSGILMHRKRPAALVTMTVITMLVMQAAIFKGYCTSDAGRSDFKELADALSARYPDGEYFNAHPGGKRPPTDLGVYLNRTIRWIGDPSTLQPGTHPLVLFMRQNKGEPDPVAPQGWMFQEKTKRDKDWWWVFVLPPS